MSRLDYFTIFIVIICILAIGLLLYQTTDLFKKAEEIPAVVPYEEGEEIPPPEEADTVGFDMEDTTDYWGDSDKVDQEGEDLMGEGMENDYFSDSGTAREGKDAAGAFEAKRGSEDYPDGDVIAQSGDYLVLGGTFIKMANAKRRLKALKQEGYERAEIVLFDRGKYAVVLVDRFSNISDARDLVSEMKSKGLEAALYKKR